MILIEVSLHFKHYFIIAVHLFKVYSLLSLRKSTKIPISPSELSDLNESPTYAPCNEYQDTTQTRAKQISISEKFI